MLEHLLQLGSVLGHPFVTGEIALGRLAARAQVLGLLGNLPGAKVATTSETLTFIEHQGLAGSGIGYVDAQLLAATRLTPGARLWTNDKRLSIVSSRLGLAAKP